MNRRNRRRVARDAADVAGAPPIDVLAELRMKLDSEIPRGRRKALRDVYDAAARLPETAQVRFFSALLMELQSQRPATRKPERRRSRLNRVTKRVYDKERESVLKHLRAIRESPVAESFSFRLEGLEYEAAVCPAHEQWRPACLYRHDPALDDSRPVGHPADARRHRLIVPLLDAKCALAVTLLERAVRVAFGKPVSPTALTRQWRRLKKRQRQLERAWHSLTPFDRVGTASATFVLIE
jgi:hypothetical protein